MRKSKILLIIIYLSGLICLSIFVITKNDFLLQWSVRSPNEIRDKYGDLYMQARVDYFKLPVGAKKPTDDSWRVSDINQSEIIMIGDSFFMAHFGEDNFPNQIAKTLQKHIFVKNEVIDYQSPFYVLKQYNYQKGEKKFIIVESSERLLKHRFFNASNLDPQVKPIALLAQPANIRLKEKFFTKTEVNYAYFAQNNILTQRFIDLINTVNFDLFGAISSKTPVYAKNPPFLFYSGSVEFFNEDHPNSMIDQIADNLSLIQKELLERYNLEMIFMPVPSKYSLYYIYTDTDRVYDDFLPRLYAALDQRDIKTVKLYDKFRQSSEFVFWFSDSHWNNLGMAIGLKELLAAIKK